MRKLILLLVLTIASMGTTWAQDGKTPHRIVFQLASPDSMVHKMLMRQLNNVRTEAPDAEIEVVCHGLGLDMLLSDRTVVRKGIASLKGKGVQFLACENTMRDRQITKEQVITEAGFVPGAIIHLVTRQEEGWSYIKAGY